MKIVISYPPFREKGHPTLGQNRQFQWFHNPSYIYPMVPASAATILSKAGHQVIWNDAIAENWRSSDYLRFMKVQKPDLVAIETKTPVVKQTWKVLAELKEILPEDTKLVLMGDHITALPEETMRNSIADFAITGGDYDISLLSIVQYLDTGAHLGKGIFYHEGNSIKTTGPFELKSNLDDLPWVDRDLTKWWLYGEKFYKRTPFTYTMAGRDCPYHKCTFCSWTTLYPNFRVRSPENLLDEIGMLIKKYKVREIFDDTGTFPTGGWLEKFCEGMIKREYHKKILFSCNFRFDYLNLPLAKLMKQAGFRLLKLGLESASDETLARLEKGSPASSIELGCRIATEAGLEVHLTIMVGYPWENKKDAQATLDLAKKLMLSGLADMLQATVVIAYPGTPLYQQALENNWFRVDPKEYERFDMTEPVFKTPDMTPEEVMALCDGIYKIFLSPRYVLRYLSKLRSVEDIIHIGRGAKAVVGHLLDFRRS